LEFLTATSMKMTVFWAVALYSLVLTNVSGELTVSIIRATKLHHSGVWYWF
jgi:hypothetical protein